LIKETNATLPTPYTTLANNGNRDQHLLLKINLLIGFERTELYQSYRFSKLIFFLARGSDLLPSSQNTRTTVMVQTDTSLHVPYDHPQRSR
jgi:hypothetical protein